MHSNDPRRAWWTVSYRSLAAAATVSILAACTADSAPATNDEPGASSSAVRAPAARAVSRAEQIAKVQREAGALFAARAVAGGFVATTPSFDVEYDGRGVHLERAGAPVGQLGLAGLGCVGGATEAVRPEGSPRAAHNRVRYARTAGRVAVEEWYLTGPMGLEQGFTVHDPPACAQAGGELEVVVDTTGFRVEATSQRATLLGAGGDRLHYTDLLATDATGRTLPSRMHLRADGRLALAVDVEGATWPVAIDPLVWVEEQVLGQGATSPGSSFGYSVAIDGDTTIVGAPSDFVGANQAQGSAVVYKFTNGSWALEQKLVANDGFPLQYFARSVALSGDTAFVGVPYQLVNGNFHQGAVYIFERTGTVWSQSQVLTRPSGVTYDEFGFSVAAHADTLVVAASNVAVNGLVHAGAAYVYVRDNGTWVEQQELTVAAPRESENLGLAVSVDQDTVVLGANGNTFGPEKWSGSAYVFVRSNGMWTQQAKLVPSDVNLNEPFDNFGLSVALSGDAVLVGAFGDNVGLNLGQGSAYVYRRSNGAWSEEQKLVAATGTAQDLFGKSVALVGDNAFVGAEFGGIDGRGAGHFFRRISGVWLESQVVDTAGYAFRNNCGTVGMSASNALLGCYASSNVLAYELRHVLGDPCATNDDCESNLCVDGVCCNDACGGGVANDCVACSLAAGAEKDGECGVSTGNVCGVVVDACTALSVCQAGACTAGVPVDCDDGDECTTNACDPAVGCTSNVEPDGTPCTGGQCQGGVCTPEGIGGAGGAGAGGATAVVGNGGAGGMGGQGGDAANGAGGRDDDRASGDGGCRIAGEPGRRMDGLSGLGALALVAVAGFRRRRRVA
jgi:hypothetical protein